MAALITRKSCSRDAHNSVRRTSSPCFKLMAPIATTLIIYLIVCNFASNESVTACTPVVTPLRPHVYTHCTYTYRYLFIHIYCHYSSSDLLLQPIKHPKLKPANQTKCILSCSGGCGLRPTLPYSLWYHSFSVVHLDDVINVQLNTLCACKKLK